MISEITEEKDEETSPFINAEDQKERIRRIIEHQKSLYSSSSSSSSILSASLASCSSFTSSHRSSSTTLLELMKGGSTSLRRLFDMEHTPLGTHLQDYSGSPLIKPILLWGSDDDDQEVQDPWESIRSFGNFNDPDEIDGAASRFASDDDDDDDRIRDRVIVVRRPKLTRKKSFRRLPGFHIWRHKRFRFKFRLKRVRIMICGKLF
ncbi:hypothetical protein Tsubulata_033711 [Turnera subulata]|uniref:Uncharacterized protein n=1 Tax=Turnera subulata TaxID=218843 RepID=A0A9Q0J7W0_9ROSI|nr:hypothetical protein Tsubulata_033711 [Turnera subulata]